MVRNLIAAFRERIDKLDWMAPSTKKEAKAKLAVLKIGVGYPDKWPDYAGLEVVAGDAYGNAERAALFKYRRSLAKLGAPVNRDEWVMTPQTVNAVNLPALNAMNFPAAILQPPFFDVAADDAVNYGSIGAVIGHEIGHGFDDQGRRFDGDGKLRDWWKPADETEFQKRAKILIEQFNNYSPLPGMNTNGELTLGENIGDLGGLSIAYRDLPLTTMKSPSMSKRAPRNCTTAISAASLVAAWRAIRPKPTISTIRSASRGGQPASA